MRVLIFLILGLALAGAAKADLTYSVYNVRPGDSLNMRLQPNPQSPVVHAIPSDASGISLTGRSSPGGWIEVTWMRKRGWVNGRFLGLGGGRSQFPAYLDCFGAEPFWSISLMPGQARADLAFIERRHFYRLTRAQSALGRVDIVHVAGAGRGNMALLLKREFCSDGMSDNRYQFSVIALLSGLNTIAGCCRPGAPK